MNAFKIVFFAVLGAFAAYWLAIALFWIVTGLIFAGALLLAGKL